MKIVPLGEIATIDRKTVKPEDIVNGTTYVGLEHIVSGGELRAVDSVANGELASGKFAFDDRHILYGKLRPYLAKIAVPSFDGICSTDILPLRVQPAADKMFVAHFLRQAHVVDQVNGLATGANLPRISPSALLTIQLPLPPIEEQRRIAAILDKADELRTKRREALAHLDTLTQSIFHQIELQADAVPRVSLADVCSRIQTGPFGSLLHKEDYVAGGIPLVNPMHIRGGKIFADSSFSVSSVMFEHLDNYQLVPGDVVLGRRGELGRCAEVFEHHGPMLCGTGSLIVRPSAGRLSSTYLSAVLSSRTVKNRLSEVAQGATMLNLNTKIVGNLEIPLPPLELQQTFATRVAAVERLKELHRNHLAELDTLFASLQHPAFKGEL